MISELFSNLVDSLFLGRKPAGNGVFPTPPELAVRKGHPRPRSAPKLTGPAPSAAPGRVPGLTPPGRRCPRRAHLGLKSWKKPRRFIAAPLPGAHGAAPPPLQGLACPGLAAAPRMRARLCREPGSQARPGFANGSCACATGRAVALPGDERGGAGGAGPRREGRSNERRGGAKAGGVGRSRPGVLASRIKFSSFLDRTVLLPV